MIRTMRATTSRSVWDAVVVGIAVAGLYWFAASFFLAKQSLPNVSACDEAPDLLMSIGMTSDEVVRLQHLRLLAPSSTPRRGCWMNRRVESVVLLLVDALRFDFCLYNLPKSVGSRMQQSSSVGLHNHTRLFRFVADPPTVTMQRLKALTTGGLPTFADISANFGGASVDDDSWIKLLNTVNYRSRGLRYPAKAGFVGDDTWEDLFPGSFVESHPYPSFNTRDLDTVDNGCFLHIPMLMDRLRSNDQSDDELEVVVVHFLGVDHVGHTYGPHNEHMSAKLASMDDSLDKVLSRLDHSGRCHAAFIFGDHGMTEDGNHGGGTEEEVSAALFVHTSPSCGEMSAAVNLEYESTSTLLTSLLYAPYASIHQIDLVPTLAVLLGLPTPFANLGSFVPSLVPGQSSAETATALALNAAQVWRYLDLYSRTANKLPNLPELHRHLHTAVEVYRETLLKPDEPGGEGFDHTSALFKHFLAKALELGQRVWTRFDSVGMLCGIFVLGLSTLLYASSLLSDGPILQTQRWEVGLSLLFMFFQCGLLTFSNSYILEEEHTIMYAMTVISTALAMRIRSLSLPTTLWRGALLLPLASRVNELFISGHGLDPSIRLHLAHHAAVFVSSLVVLGSLRYFLFRKGVLSSILHTLLDLVSLLLLAVGWWEKRSIDPDRHGFVATRGALALVLIGTLALAVHAVVKEVQEGPKGNASINERSSQRIILAVFVKLLIAIMAVTGPATAASLVLYSFQASVVYFLSRMEAPHWPQSLVLAALWKLVTRHVFFATNHGCGFNRLQYSAAFVTTTEFYFVRGGISLFLNTFGWEIAGLMFAWLLSRQAGHGELWRIYTTYQLLEAFTSCISVSILRRHLMVWDIYAPHFLFTSIFTVLNGMSQLTLAILRL